MSQLRLTVRSTRFARVHSNANDARQAASSGQSAIQRGHDMPPPPNDETDRLALIDELCVAHAARHELERELTRLQQQNAALFEACVGAESASRARSRLFANMGHDIRTPLNGVVGMAGILAQTRLDPNQREITGVIETSARALHALLIDVLDLAGLDAGRTELVVQPFSLDELAESLERRFAPDMAAKGLPFTVRIAASARAVQIFGDAQRLRQAIGRLLCNSAKFTDRGGVELDVDLGPAGEARITVSDTGAFLQPFEAARIFDGPVEGGDPPGRRHAGAGIGLAISRSLIEAMGGTVRAEAWSLDGEQESGVRFTVSMPAALPQAQAA